MKELFFEVADGGANVAVANCGGAMEADTIKKTGGIRKATRVGITF